MRSPASWFDRRMRVLEAVDTWQDRMESSPASLEATETFYEKAYNLITAPRAKRAFAIGHEDPRLRDRHGRHSLGQGCLLARRLVESGVRFVTVTDGGWDTHQKNFQSLSERLLPRLDQALATLIEDLSDRGQLDSTLVLVLSDFGRTPKVNPSAGRDHWSTAGVALLAGGGIRPGVAVGRTNALGEQPIEAPYVTEDLAATIFRSARHPALDHPPHSRWPPDPGRRRRPPDPRIALNLPGPRPSETSPRPQGPAGEFGPPPPSRPSRGGIAMVPRPPRGPHERSHRIAHARPVRGASRRLDASRALGEDGTHPLAPCASSSRRPNFPGLGPVPRTLRRVGSYP